MSYYAQIVDVPAPVEVYDAIHAETLRRTDGRVDGLLVHVARPTGEGFQVIEVWADRDSCERADAEILGPIMAGLVGSGPTAAATPAVEEFVPRGLVVPGDRAVL